MTYGLGFERRSDPDYEFDLDAYRAEVVEFAREVLEAGGIDASEYCDSRREPRSERRVHLPESVTEGHPDKIADQISDAILDACLEEDPDARVACERSWLPGMSCSRAKSRPPRKVDHASIARKTIARIGYDDPELGFDAATVQVTDLIGEQSSEIAAGVDRSLEARAGHVAAELVAGAGDQGMMFGYATDETEELMPRPIALAHALAGALADARRSGAIDGLRPDGKTQVTVRYENGVPTGLERIVISTRARRGSTRKSCAMRCSRNSSSR